MLDFERPGFLFFIPVALGLLWLGQRHSLTGWTKRQARACTFTRCLIVLLVCLALAGPRWALPGTEPIVIFLRDVSASLSAASQEKITAFLAEAKPDPKRSAEVEFAGEPRVTRSLGEANGAEETPKPSPRAAATNISGALEFAAALLPSDQPGRIVLLTDGQYTDGVHPVATASSLAERGVEVDVLPLRETPGEEASLVSVSLPKSVREGEVFDLPVDVQAGVETPATLRLYQNNLLVSTSTTQLISGSNRIVFPNIRADGRLATYEVQLVAAKDTLTENNRHRAATAHAGAARILVIDRAPVQAEPLAKAWRDAGFEVEVRPPVGFPSRMEDLEAFDLIVFSDAPALDFRDDQFVLLQGWVRDFGGAFLMLGGEGSFGAGAYFRTPVAAMLPVRIEREEREETPVVALLVILDRSGSMSAPAGEQTKMDLANEGAALAMEILQAKDLFGVFAVDTKVQDVLSLGRISDRAGAVRRIAGITSGGGGIYIYTSLAEAYPALRDAKARIKHIILFSDAADAEEKTSGEMGNKKDGGGSALDLATAMLANRITLSVVALGTEQDQDTTFLRQLAAQGGGRFYLTADATTLPRLFTIETMRAAESSLKEDAFSARPILTGSPVLDGLDWAASPLLLGLNVTKLKPGAEQLLTNEQDDPLLATWRYGLGQVAAFTSDAKARWASEWLAWPGFGKFWTQTARQLVRAGDRKDLSVRIREEDGLIVVEAEGISEKGDFRNGLTVSVTTTNGQGSAETSAAPQVAPGLYRATLPMPKGDSAFFAVSDGTGRPVPLAWAREYPPEFRPVTDQAPLLQKIAQVSSGKFNPSPGEIFRPARHSVAARREIAPFLLGFAVLLWPLDVWLRRRDWQT